MIILDTTVLAYAVGDSHPLADPCRRIIDAIGDGHLRATTTVEVVQEFLHHHARRGRRGEAVSRARAYARLLAPLIIVDADDLDAGLRLFAEHETLGAFDAVLGAVTMRRDGAVLVSAGGGFRAISGLSHLDPGEPRSLDGLLGR